MCSANGTLDQYIASFKKLIVDRLGVTSPAKQPTDAKPAFQEMAARRLLILGTWVEWHCLHNFACAASEDADYQSLMPMSLQALCVTETHPEHIRKHDDSNSFRAPLRTILHITLYCIITYTVYVVHQLTRVNCSGQNSDDPQG